MKIRLDRLYVGEHEIEHRESPEALDLESETYRDPVNIVMHWDRRDPYIRVWFNISCQRQSQCDRCLSDFAYPLQAEAEVLIQLRDEGIDDNDDPDYKVVSPSEPELDFTVDIRDAILLAIPSKILCADDCRGLCSRCGVNLNEETCRCDTDVVNPQWEVLRKFKES
jgi:uncharacterized protein